MMLARLSALLAAIALFFAPLAMQSGAAMAMQPAAHSGMAMEHCDEDSPADTAPMSKADCAAACAAIPALHARIDSPQAAPRLIAVPLPAVRFTGLAAEAETPPPRTS